MGESGGVPGGVDPERLLQQLRDRREEMAAALRALAELESPTAEPDRQRAVFDRLAGSLEEACGKREAT